jgi:2-oxo-3-hexenedioate decarboxylase
MPDIVAIAETLARAYAERAILPAPPSSGDPAFDLDAGYAVESALVARRRGDGHHPVGRKVGYANKALWRMHGLETLVWAHMYDDTVQHADRDEAALSIARMCSPRIEPEIVFGMKPPVLGAGPDSVLDAVDWLALGFEIVDCVYADWKYQPADFVAAFGLHAALVVGTPSPVTPDRYAALADALPRFTVTLGEGGRTVAAGSGRNALRGPHLCLAELQAAIGRRCPDEPLAAGELVSSGTLTESASIAAGQIWTATVDGLDLPPLTLRLV